MDSERRTVADALDTDDKIGQFISNGLANLSTESSEASPSVESAGLDGGEPAKDAPSKQPERKNRSVSKPRKISDEQLSRTLAKSVIQKTVRFKPTLIAQLEDWIRRQEADGNVQTTFQQIQNEALELWLDRNS